MKNERYKLLIVDDQAPQLTEYVALFEPAFDCYTAISGEAAIDIFHQQTPHAVLCDVKMPGGMSGYDLCQQIKSVSPQTLIILSSSYNNTTLRLKGYECRADEYLNKLTGKEETFLKVRNLIYTQNSRPAAFTPDNKEASMKSANTFEDDVRAIISDYYATAIHARSVKKIDLDTISMAFHKSRRTIQRGFLREVDCTFSDFHNRTRLDLAAKLLISSGKSVKEIAEELNFSSPSVFSQSFKQLHGITPSKYRHHYLDDEQ